MEEDTLFKWLKDEIKEIKDTINFLRTDSIPHIHERIDKVYEELNTGLKGKHIFYLFIFFITGLIGVEGIKGIIPIILKILK